MKKKKIIVVLILAVLSIGFYFKDDITKIKHHIYPIQSNKKLEKQETIEEEQIVKEDSKVKIKTEKEEAKEKIKTEQEEVKEEVKENNNSSKTETKKENVNNQKIEMPKQDPPKNNNNQHSESGNSNENIKHEEKPVVVQKQPWEELGLTEDQYKNQPMYSWEEVDFKTKEECMNYGNEHAEYGFECSEVTSWTRSLGWDYRTF